jgi:TolA-binding protein
VNPLPEERELARLEKSQDDAQERVATLELELETLKSETSKFQHHYNRTIGKLYVEIDEWRARIARARAGQSSGDSAAEQEAAEAEARAQDSAREAGLIEDDPEPSLQITPELRHAYRQAAKLVHPDRATTESERIRRTASQRIKVT